MGSGWHSNNKVMVTLLTEGFGDPVQQSPAPSRHQLPLRKAFQPTIIAVQLSVLHEQNINKQA
jgi:hypothetical protein